MPNVRFAVGIQRLIPFLGYHHVLMILIAIAIILLCTSPQASISSPKEREVTLSPPNSPS